MLDKMAANDYGRISRDAFVCQEFFGPDVLPGSRKTTLVPLTA